MQPNDSISVKPVYENCCRSQRLKLWRFETLSDCRLLSFASPKVVEIKHSTKKKGFQTVPLKSYLNHLDYSKMLDKDCSYWIEFNFEN